VAASRPANDLAPFSNFGRTSVHLAAPGINIRSTAADSDSAYGFMSGSSQAASLVGGAAALLWAAKPTATVAEVK